jgi:hypothetical protein
MRITRGVARVGGTPGVVKLAKVYTRVYPRVYHGVPLLGSFDGENSAFSHSEPFFFDAIV